ncbi:hypothetical protein FOQG_04189 [Fusarium oxysporum f. sp. raphani 54005]|uniref:Uncharacterized protein n=2 Tax=Fusarium oxysporum f. sp. raphani TaxID=96318 RepID=X0CXQ1_FUSOX|nr:hypothetical protein FOQG_04189 [Fusarium oxysporum f. sp. raphani 54005]KAG7433382.1 hypothetical protein Forpi1262_v006888 [Fusarium oxysporum f. sp. raphani]
MSSNNKDQDTPMEHDDLPVRTAVNAQEGQAPAPGNTAPSGNNNNGTPVVAPVVGGGQAPLGTGSSFHGAMGFSVGSGGGRGGRGGRGGACGGGGGGGGVFGGGFGAGFDAGFGGGVSGNQNSGHGYNSGRGGRGNSGSGWGNFGHGQGRGRGRGRGRGHSPRGGIVKEQRLTTVPRLNVSEWRDSQGNSVRLSISNPTRGGGQQVALKAPTCHGGQFGLVQNPNQAAELTADVFRETGARNLATWAEPHLITRTRLRNADT